MAGDVIDYYNNLYFGSQQPQTESVQNEVWGALERGESRIGIYGTGGVGKTRVAMLFKNEILSAGRDDFKHVYYVTVSQGSSVHKLQKDIAKALALNLKNTDVKKRAAELHMSLKERKKSLLILDDIWEDIPMEQVGVAVEGDGCKLLITTRKSRVCKDMNCSAIVEMKPLLGKEAWDLFVNQLGNYEELSDKAKVVARYICKECVGLPLGIITMARCMRGELDEHEWRDMLRQLRNTSTEQDGMQEKVFSILKLSYERLNNAKLQECFLYCALYPEDERIQRDKLIDRFIALELINESTREENIDKGHSMLNALEGASLLESAPMNGVRMHDLVRDMAIKIIDCKGIVKARKELKEIPRKEEWTKDLVQVSLMENEITGIGDEICPECPNLSVLILCHNPLENISESLFVGMVGLRILDLSFTYIRKLPDSISSLCNLSALFLRVCQQLSIIPSLAGLTKLRELDLGLCRKIKEWPKGVEELINLKHLDISHTEIQSIPDGLMYKFSKLECFTSNTNGIVMMPMKLMSLRQLWRLECRIDDVDAFNQMVGSGYFNQLQMYTLIVGGGMNWYAGRKRAMCYTGQSSIGTEVSLNFPQNVQILKFDMCSFGVKSLLDALPSLCGARELENLSFYGCEGIEYIISDAWFNRGGDEVSKPFTRVQQLQVQYLEDLVGLVEGGMVHPYVCFDGLRKLDIQGCPRLNHIWLQNDVDLPNLECIKLGDCGSIEELFATTKEKCLPKLQALELYDLLKLKSICREGVFFPELRRLKIKDCPKLKRVGLVNHNMPSLEDITIISCKEMEEIFDRGDDVIQLPNLQRMVLVGLPELRSIYNFPISVPRV